MADADSIEEGRAALAARGVHTELDYERSRAGEGARATVRHTGQQPRNYRDLAAWSGSQPDGTLDRASTNLDGGWRG